MRQNCQAMPQAGVPNRRYGSEGDGFTRPSAAFTITELVTVIAIIALLVGTAVFVIAGSLNRTDLEAGTEIIKQAIRKTYALADSGAKTNNERDRYRIEFHTSSENPPNAYRIVKQTYNGSNWNTSPWSLVSIDRSAYVSSVGTGNQQWLKFSNNSSVRISGYTGMSTFQTLSGGGSNSGITFESKGSIVTTELHSAGLKTITMTDGETNKVITVSQYGSVSD